MAGLVPTRPPTAGEHIEHLADEAMARLRAERLEAARKNPKQVDIKYQIDGREATEEELQDLAQIQEEKESAFQQRLNRLYRVRQRMQAWFDLVTELDERHRAQLGLVVP